jgi:hypothetical protein
MPGTLMRISTAMPKAPGLPVIGPIPTEELMLTSPGSASFWRAATAFIAPIKQAA